MNNSDYDSAIALCRAAWRARLETNMTDRTNAERQRRFRQRQVNERIRLELENAQLRLQDKVVLDSLWQIVKMQHEALTSSGKALELFFDIMPEEHKINAAKRLDIYSHFMNTCDKLIAPLREIMEKSE